MLRLTEFNGDITEATQLKHMTPDFLYHGLSRKIRSNSEPVSELYNYIELQMHDNGVPVAALRFDYEFKKLSKYDPLHLLSDLEPLDLILES